MTRVALWLSLLLFLAGCVSSAPAPAPGARAVSFTTQDGVTLRGYLFGTGGDGVILSHMFPADQRSWFPFAEFLAEKGFRVLTFDFRGYGASGGSKEIALIDKDVTAAISWLRGEGVRNVFLVGASMGGTASIEAAAESPVSAVVALSAPTEFQGLSALDAIGRLTAPVFFIASEGDRAAAESARSLYQKAPGPKEIRILPGSDHGTDLLKGTQRRVAEEAILGFLLKYR